MKTMVADQKISILHHEGATYKPNKAGEFEIQDNHVNGVRPHGLMLKEEAEAKKKAKAGGASVESLAAENAALKAELEQLKKTKA